MLVLSKELVINELSLEVNAQVLSSDRKVRLKGRINSMVLSMVENATLATYKNLAHTQNGALNKGYIVEDIVLDWKGLEQETRYCEVKFFGNETPNILVNAETRLVYIVVAKATCKGAYIIRDMKAIRNKRLTLNYLLENGLLNNHCVELENYLGL
jgi:hypothetical protein